jgi:hypothetical protein
MSVSLIDVATGEMQRIAVPDPGEAWAQVRLRPPAHWGGGPVVLELRDGVTGPRGWVAVHGPYADPLGLSLFATLALAAAGAALLGAWRVTRRESRAGRKAFLLAAILLALMGLRLTVEGRMISIDEEIPVMVSDAMQARGDLDPDWGRTAMRDGFRYPSYNFYAYNVAAHAVIAIGDAWRAPSIVSLRAFNVFLQLGAALLVFSALTRPGAPGAARWLATAGVALAPMAVQDAFIARPESLLYLLTALALWVALRVGAPGRRLVALAAVVAAGMAVKLTFLSVAILAAPTLGTLWRAGWREALRSVALASVVFAGVLAASMPYAFLNASALLNGMRALAEQYAGGHAPHSLPEPDRLRFIGWVLGYFALTLGGLLVAAPLAPLLARGKAGLDGVVGAAFASAAVVFAYFATQNVFFERNFAHAMLLLIVVSSVGIAAIAGPRLRVLAAAAALAAPLWWAPQVSDAARRGDRALLADKGTDREGAPTVYFSSPRDCRGLVRFLDFNDPFSKAALTEMKAQGFREERFSPGRFRAVPTSTLQVYLEADSRYLRCPQR